MMPIVFKNFHLRVCSLEDQQFLLTKSLFVAAQTKKLHNITITITNNNKNKNNSKAAIRLIKR